jgi:hypothetical protein
MYALSLVVAILLHRKVILSGTLEGSMVITKKRVLVVFPLQQPLLPLPLLPLQNHFRYSFHPFLNYLPHLRHLEAHFHQSVLLEVDLP